MATRNNAGDQKFTNSSDGFVLGGGTTERDLTVTGGNLTLTGSGSATLTFPSSSDTIAGLAATQTFTNKTITDSSNTIGAVTWSNNAITANAFATNAIKLGYAQATSDGTTTSTTLTAFTTTTLSVTVTVPAGGRDIKITVCGSFKGSVSGDGYMIGIVESGSTALGQFTWTQNGNNYYTPITLVAHISAPSAASHTYNVYGAAAGGTLTMIGGALSTGAIGDGPTSILVEAI
jgi:hypothetical protein